MKLQNFFIPKFVNITRISWVQLEEFEGVLNLSNNFLNIIKLTNEATGRGMELMLKKMTLVLESLFRFRPSYEII